MGGREGSRPGGRVPELAPGYKGRRAQGLAEGPPTLAPSCPCAPHPCALLPLHPPAPPTLAVRAQGLVPMQFELVFLAPPPLSTKSSVKTKSVQVSPPPEHRTTTPCTFTEWQRHRSPPPVKNFEAKTASQPLR